MFRYLSFAGMVLRLNSFHGIQIAKTKHAKPQGGSLDNVVPGSYQYLTSQSRRNREILPIGLSVLDRGSWENTRSSSHTTLQMAGRTTTL
jgi:hypothetical protein